MVEIDVSRLGQVTLIEVQGRIDGVTAPQLGVALRDQLAQGHMQLVVDLSGVEYMSSAGLREIVTALKQARQQPKGDLRVSRPTERVREIMELAGLDQIVMIFSTPDEAVASF
jgi:anti-anti-sigma factor